MVPGLNAEQFEAALDTVKGYGTDSLDVESAALYINGVRVSKVMVQDTWDGGEKLVCLALADDDEPDYEIDGVGYIELHPDVEQLNSICEQINYWY